MQNNTITNDLLLSILNKYSKKFIVRDRKKLLKILAEKGTDKLIEQLEQDIKECSN